MAVQIVDIDESVDYHFLFLTISPLQLCLVRAYHKITFVSKKNVDSIRDSQAKLVSSRRMSPIKIQKLQQQQKNNNNNIKRIWEEF